MSSVKRVRALKNCEHIGLTAREASAVARAYGMKRPRVGYEVRLEPHLTLRSTGHFQFGWFESTATHPYEVARYKP